MSTPVKTGASIAARMLAVSARSDLLPLLPAAINQRALHVEHATGSAEACRQLARISFDVVLADIDVASSAAVDLLGCLQRAKPDIKVILISTGRSPGVIAELLRRRAFSVLIRPISEVRLAEVIEQALASEDWLDDIVLISGTPKWVQVQIRCKLQAAERAAQLFRELPGDIETQEYEELTTAFREMLMNAIEHGGRSDPNETIFVSHVWTARELVFYIRDPGEGFSLDHLPHAAISNPDGTLEHAEVREQKGIRPGGFGILLARNMVDELIYSERGNEVLLIKHRKLAPTPQTPAPQTK